MKKERIKRAIYLWGYYPALFVLKEEQSKENYENCQVIKEALDEVSDGKDWGLTTKVDDVNMNRNYDNIIKELDNPEIIDANMPYYIEEFKEYILIR